MTPSRRQCFCLPLPLASSLRSVRTCLKTTASAAHGVTTCPLPGPVGRGPSGFAGSAGAASPEGAWPGPHSEGSPGEGAASKSHCPAGQLGGVQVGWLPQAEHPEQAAGHPESVGTGGGPQGLCLEDRQLQDGLGSLRAESLPSRGHCPPAQGPGADDGAWGLQGPSEGDALRDRVP